MKPSIIAICILGSIILCDALPREYNDGMAMETTHTIKKPKAYIDMKEGTCDNDGMYYKDRTSYIICTNKYAYTQPCGGGTANEDASMYEMMVSYPYWAFCNVNTMASDQGMMPDIAEQDMTSYDNMAPENDRMPTIERKVKEMMPNMEYKVNNMMPNVEYKVKDMMSNTDYNVMEMKGSGDMDNVHVNIITKHQMGMPMVDTSLAKMRKPTMVDSYDAINVNEADARRSDMPGPPMSSPPMPDTYMPGSPIAGPPMPRQSMGGENMDNNYSRQPMPLFRLPKGAMWRHSILPGLGFRFYHPYPFYGRH